MFNRFCYDDDEGMEGERGGRRDSDSEFAEQTLKGEKEVAFRFDLFTCELSPRPRPPLRSFACVCNDAGRSNRSLR